MLQDISYDFYVFTLMSTIITWAIMLFDSRLTNNSEKLDKFYIISSFAIPVFALISFLLYVIGEKLC